jgi:hypothetical protein
VRRCSLPLLLLLLLLSLSLLQRRCRRIWRERVVPVRRRSRCASATVVRALPQCTERRVGRHAAAAVCAGDQNAAKEHHAHRVDGHRS